MPSLFFSLIGAVPDPSGGELLTRFLTSDKLLWGCLALALIAMLTVGRVASRRREAVKTNRILRKQSDAVHEFLAQIRLEHGKANQGVWHYDFASGSEQFSQEFLQLFSAIEDEALTHDVVHGLLKDANVDLVAVARRQFEESDPYEIAFTVRHPDGTARPMILRACNLRNAKGEVQRLVAVVRDAG